MESRTAKWIKNYSSDHKILLVGEGDFSFAACLATTFGDASNIVATSLDSKVELKYKYSEAMTNLEKLESLGCVVIHQVDAHTMSQHPILKDKLFDKIVFNFPHATLMSLEHDPRQIRDHQKLIKRFFKSARELLTRGGEVHVTHKIVYPFSSWEIQILALDLGLHLAQAPSFNLSDYPGYCNKRGYGPHCDTAFPVGACRTYVFQTIESLLEFLHKSSGLLDEVMPLTSNCVSPLITQDTIEEVLSKLSLKSGPSLTVISASSNNLDDIN